MHVQAIDARVSAITGTLGGSLSFAEDYCSLEMVHLSGWNRQGDQWVMDLYNVN
jgi:hypothetical protein